LKNPPPASPPLAPPAHSSSPSHGDWTLLIEIQQRDYLVVYRRDEAAA
jgi:hypothetical protein